GLTNPFTGKQMAPEAGHVADELEMTRADMDRFALRSHQLAVEATDAGRLPEEIVDVTVKGKKGDTTVEIDEGPRRDASLEALSKAQADPGQRLAHRGQLARRQRRRGRSRARLGGV